jgi:hypothetical protein
MWSDSARHARGGITSRRTGLQMGFAAVTEANTGDFTVKLKPSAAARRRRDGRRARTDQVHRAGAGHRAHQVLQDNINDLSNAPEPIQIKIFSSDPIAQPARPRVGDAIGKIPGVVDVENGVDNTISGPATNFQVIPISRRASALLPVKSLSTQPRSSTASHLTDPLIANGRPYTIRVRLGDETPRLARRHPEHGLQQQLPATPHRSARWPP